LMSHWVEQIWWYGALQQYSAERHDVAHKTNLKDCWKASNHNLNYLPQVITFQRPQYPGIRSASREQCCHMQCPPFRHWSGFPPELPVICEAQIYGTPTPPQWIASWCDD
jgi:hypothetical protein